MDPAVAAALAALRAAVANCHGRRPSFLQLLYPDGTAELIPFPPREAVLPTVEVTPQGTRVPTSTERAILAVLERAEKPLKAQAIVSRARRLGFDLEYNPYLRRVLSAMVKPEDGRLVYVGRDGYWLASRPLPDVSA